MSSRQQGARTSADSVERALDGHVRDGRLRGWKRHPDGGYVVDIPHWGPERLKTVREGHVFALGLASAHHAAT